MQDDSRYDDASLFSLLAGGSEYAFQLIFDRYRDHIYHVAMLYLKSPALAEEVVQDVFLKLWFQRQDVQKVHSMQAWLYTIAKNVCLNLLRKVAKERNVFEKLGDHNSASENNVDFKIRNDECSELIEKAVSNLSLRQQQVYRLAREAGQSYEEIGKTLSMSPLTVKTHMSRALDTIREYLKKHGELYILVFLMS